MKDKTILAGLFVICCPTGGAVDVGLLRFCSFD